MRKCLLFIIIISFFTIKAYAQEYGTLRGVVVDSSNSEALSYASVGILELKVGAYTDARGYFVITKVPVGKTFTLSVSYVGYNTKQIKVTSKAGKVSNYQIKLVPSGIDIQAVEQVAERITHQNETNISLEKIAIKQLEALPQGVETDVFRSIKQMPGVQSTSDVSAQYYVRGGGGDQNLVLIDGVTLYNPFHALGLFSAVDPDIINNLEFYKGGFSAEYGGRLSSVMNIITKDGNKNKFGLTATSSFLTGKALLEGPIPHGSFIITGRKSYSTEILKKFLDDKNVPSDFYDLAFKLNYSNPDFIEGAKFLVNGFFSGDKVSNSSPYIEDYKWNNDMFSFRWFQVGDSPLFYEIGTSISRFTGEIIPKYSGTQPMSSEVSDYGLKMDFNYIFDNRNEINLGFHIQQVQSRLTLEEDNDETTVYDNSSANIVLFAKYKFLQIDNFGIDLGARVNAASLSAQGSKTAVLEPRFSITYKPFSFLSFKGAIGRYRQELITITDENDVISIFEPWIVVPTYLNIPYSDHYIGGFQIDFSENLKFTVEGYYKTMTNLVFKNYDKIYENDPDFINGDGEAYGGEFGIKYSYEFINLSAAYTHGYSYKIIDGKRYYPRYDSRHNVNTSMELNLGAGWQFSAMWTYSSGLPFTQIIGYYDKLYLTDLFAEWYVDQRTPYTMLGTQNLGRLPDYHRLDLSLSKKFDFNFMRVAFDLNIINVYNRKNIFYFKRDTGERVNMLPFLPTATVKVEL